MTYPRSCHRSIGVIAFCFAAVALAGCTSPSSVGGEGGSGGPSTTGDGGSPGTGGGATGGTNATGGSPGTGGLTGTGGAPRAARLGRAAHRHRRRQRRHDGDGRHAAAAVRPAAPARRAPARRGPSRAAGRCTRAIRQGTAAGLTWQLWANGNGGSITTFSVPAFSAAWNNSGDFLARTGLEWGNSGQAVSSLGTVTAQFAETKSGSGGQYSYIGIYGWSINPCIEWYIIDDSYNKMPVNPGSTTNKGTVTIDGGSYTLYTRPTTGNRRQPMWHTSPAGRSFTVSGRRPAPAGRYPLPITSMPGAARA